MIRLPGINLKNLAIVQVILGALVVGSFFAFGSWLAGGYYAYEGIIPGTDTSVLLRINPSDNMLLEAWQFVYLALGLLVVIFGISQFVRARSPAAGRGVVLTTVQVFFGIVIIALLVWFIGWLEPETASYTELVDGVEVLLSSSPGWITGVILWKVLSFTLGLVIIGCGIIQYRRESNS